jgi:uncharacterized protein YbaP (TraB family)
VRDGTAGHRPRCAGATARPTAAAAKPPVPLLWKSPARAMRAYLLGSFHLLKPQDYPLSPDVEQAFEASQRVVFELSPEDMQSPQLASRMVQAATRTDGSELKRDLDAATWQKLQAFAAENKLPLAQMQGMKPWFVGLSISVGQMQKLGLDPALGLDRHFMERAQKTGRKTGGLEDIDTQIGMLDGMTVQEQRQMLAEALDQAARPMSRRGCCTMHGGAATSACCGPRWPRRCASSIRSCTSASTPGATMPGCRSCSRTCRPGRAVRWWWSARCTCWAVMAWSRS